MKLELKKNSYGGFKVVNTGFEIDKDESNKWVIYLGIGRFDRRSFKTKRECLECVYESLERIFKQYHKSASLSM